MYVTRACSPLVFKVKFLTFYALEGRSENLGCSVQLDSQGNNSQCFGSTITLLVLHDFIRLYLKDSLTVFSNSNPGT